MNHCVHLCFSHKIGRSCIAASVHCLIVQCLEAEMKETKAIGQSVRHLGVF